MQVGFEINNKIVHVNIKTPLNVMSKEDYEAEYGDKCYVRKIFEANLDNYVTVRTIREIRCFKSALHS